MNRNSPRSMETVQDLHEDHNPQTSLEEYRRTWTDQFYEHMSASILSEPNTISWNSTSCNGLGIRPE